MDLGLNWVDLIILLVLVFFMAESFGRSLLLELLDLASFLLAFFLSFRYYNLPAKLLEANFDIPHGLSLVLGFVTAWFITEIFFYGVTLFIIPKLPKLKITGLQFLSIIPALFRGLIFISVFLLLIATFPIQPTLKKDVNQSKIGSFLLKQSYKLEAPIKQVFGGIIEDNLTFLTIKPKTNERVNLGFKTSDFKVSEADEVAMIDLVNKERVSRNLNALTFDSTLRKVARDHSEDMFKRGYFSHISPEGKDVVDRAKKYDVNFLVIGENLAYAPSWELAHKGLMNSEGHRANILSPDFNKIGIGVMDGGDFAKMFTQVFSD